MDMSTEHLKYVILYEFRKDNTVTEAKYCLQKKLLRDLEKVTSA